MKLRLLRCLRSIILLTFLTSVVMVAALSQAEPLPLDRAIRLALAHSTRSAIATADVQRAFASYREIHDNYVPQLFIGSGLGYSYGFPLSIEGAAPALANAVAQSTVFNLSQRQFVNAAKTEWHASEVQDKDQRNAVILDVALTYAELAKWEARLAHLQQDETLAEQMQQAVAERVQAGVDSAIDLNKAKLTAARVRLHRAEARGSADVLRRHLATLTGLPVSTIEIAPEKFLPAARRRGRRSFRESRSLEPRDQDCRGALSRGSMRALGEHRALYPTIDFSAQYARLSTINNYNQYYTHFRPDNATVGFALRIPIFNASQRARADDAEAEALKAKKQAEAARNQVSEECLKLQRTAEQLEAAREVAQLEYQLAQSALEAAQTRIDAKTGTLHELADARVQAAERYLFFQDADFEYQKARVNLLRATGDLEKWALP